MAASFSLKDRGWGYLCLQECQRGAVRCVLWYSLAPDWQDTFFSRALTLALGKPSPCWSIAVTIIRNWVLIVSHEIRSGSRPSSLIVGKYGFGFGPSVSIVSRLEPEWL